MLQTACSKGHIAIVQELLRRGANVNAVDARGDTALIRAASCNKSAVVSLLLESGADMNMVNELGNTALCVAVKHGAHRAVSVLLDAGASPNVVNNVHDTPLLIAIRAHDELSMTMLLRAGADVEAQSSDGHFLPIHVAVMTNVPTITRLLINHGANVNAQTTKGVTPLMCAAELGYDTLIYLLHEHGANVHARSADSVTALHLAIHHYRLHAVTALVACGARVHDRVKLDHSDTHLLYAIRRNYVQVVETLFEHDATLFNADPEPTHTLYHVPLLVIVCNHRIAILRALLERGLDPNTRVLQHFPLIMIAAWANMNDMVSALLESGAHVDHHPLPFEAGNGALGVIRNSFSGRVWEPVDSFVRVLGNVRASRWKRHMTWFRDLACRMCIWGSPFAQRATALHYAVMDENYSMARVLCLHGANVRALCFDAKQALHLISRGPNCRDMVTLLIDSGADIEAHDEIRDTPLHWAAFHGDVRLVRALVEAGADVQAQNDDGESALDVAINHDSAECADYLRAERQQL
jgi:ankyrin repeat protein